FENVKRKRQGLKELEYSKKNIKETYKEIHDTTINILEKLSKYVPTYSILGNVGTNMIKNSEVKKDEKRYKIKLPYLKNSLKKLNNFHLIRGKKKKINGLQIGFLEYFTDNSWIKEFKEKDKKRISEAEIETLNAKKILKKFEKLDILICHQPPYKILDKVTAKYAPKHYQGKHAGSKAILDYIKKYIPKYVFCGHIHEAKGKAKIGKTKIYNVGSSGDYLILDTEKDKIIESNFLK
ncbi:MAG: metallophosphoesterase, partial [Candidatus Pacearchaeota archaeon]|nr:metallophosphoesterase [Candidatus Pacearchaeota archaeon]